MNIDDTEIDNTGLEVDAHRLHNWVTRPLSEAERATAKAAYERIVHRFDCLCDECSCTRRGMVAENAYNQRRLLSESEGRVFRRRTRRRVDGLGCLIVGILIGMAFFAFVVCPAFDEIVRGAR